MKFLYFQKRINKKFGGNGARVTPRGLNTLRKKNLRGAPLAKHRGTPPTPWYAKKRSAPFV
jgi:hypothetical protein